MDDKIKIMRNLCRTRPLIYSDLDHLKKGSTKFLCEAGYPLDAICKALNLSMHDVQNNLRPSGYELDYRKIIPFENILPEHIGDSVTIRVPSWGNDPGNLIFQARVVQCIPRGGGCGLSVILLEETEFEIPLYGKGKKGDEIVVPAEWILR